MVTSDIKLRSFEYHVSGSHMQDIVLDGCESHMDSSLYCISLLRVQSKPSTCYVPLLSMTHNIRIPHPVVCLSYYIQDVKHPATAKFRPRKHSELCTVFDCHLGMCDFRFPLWSRLELRSFGLLMGLKGCPEMSVMTYHYLLCNNPEQCSSHCLGSYPNLVAKMPFQWPPKQIISTLVFTAYISIMTHTILITY